MRQLLPFLFVLLAACYFDVKVTKKYELYFDDSTYKIFLNGLGDYQKENYLLADSLFTIVISHSSNKLSMTMPTEFNPYYYRGHNSLYLDKYEQAISDFEHVASDTTTNTDILLARTEAFRMLHQYDTCIVLCNRLLDLKHDSSIILSQRGLCYFQKGQKGKACEDLTNSKRLATGDVSFLDKFLEDCK
jgi:tetratricopeptide (TPR) repeat protein